MQRAQGIDVSHYHAVTDWAAVMDAGIWMFGAKATQGTMYVDPTFRAHRDGARSMPFALVIYYHFATPHRELGFALSSGDPVKQAAHFLDVVGPLRDNERLALDVEGEGAPPPIWIDAFLAQLPQDRRNLIYTSSRIWRDELGAPAWPDAIATDLWVPRYSSTEPILPADRDGFPIWPRWTIWQDSEKFACPGVDGPCDHNVFRGDLDELRAYARLPGAGG